MSGWFIKPSENGQKIFSQLDNIDKESNNISTPNHPAVVKFQQEKAAPQLARDPVEIRFNLCRSLGALPEGDG
jgi:hypothetical protein